MAQFPLSFSWDLGIGNRPEDFRDQNTVEYINDVDGAKGFSEEL